MPTYAYTAKKLTLRARMWKIKFHCVRGSCGENHLIFYMGQSYDEPAASRKVFEQQRETFAVRRLSEGYSNTSNHQQKERRSLGRASSLQTPIKKVSLLVVIN